ncbi:hypothetical protein UA08_04678 [Talaromyces atroroseus]|uniref:Non-reducing end beta-L-arabinofuranosidase n=1 Tax=Talaromyces atroroseus TaxID=1441469 RepID=A0A225AW78_TALAT|nr:hypothetical protein UA08_04678 [Talaromyces atroroseus]OKL59869.1 hypothetical protein UA08_04678 [Talaromyces atroroseus]
MSSPSAIRDVNITSAFWTSMQSRSRLLTIPAIIHAQKSLGHWYCLTWKEGHKTKPHAFWDSDIYKVTEAACYFLLKEHPEGKDDLILRQEVEHAVDMIRAAQHEDGYLNSYYTVRGVHKRWTNVRDMHELYCLGHLIEACVAYETLTNSGRLLEPVMKALKHVDSVFGPEDGKLHGYPGHPEIELGLLRLYELTKEPLPLKLAKYFILERGQRDANGEIFYDHEARARGGDPYDAMGSEMPNPYTHPRDYAYQQAHAPLVEQDEIKGHSVRAMYFVTAATEYVRLTGDIQVKEALDRLWRNTVDKKLYITGALGAMRQSEGFGPDYFLGDTEESHGCYAETCATFALIVWCSKLLRQELKGEYGDVMEIALYNGFLGAVGLDGKSFYYQNPLRTFTGHKKERSTWFEVACCPPNVAKLLGQLESLIYSSYEQESLVAVHLWIASEFSVPESGGTLVSQTTNLPWSGDIQLTVRGPKALKLALRIPDWAASNYSCSLSGGEVKDGYLYLAAVANTTISLNFPLQPRKVYANPKTGKDEICIMRGPLVYCIEDVDNPGVDIDHIALIADDIVADAPAATIASVEDVVRVHSPGKEIVNANWSSLYGSEEWKYGDSTKQLTFVPYFLRMNRGGNGGMRVWVKRIQC